MKNGKETKEEEKEKKKIFREIIGRQFPPGTL